MSRTSFFFIIALLVATALTFFVCCSSVTEAVPLKDSLLAASSKDKDKMSSSSSSSSCSGTRMPGTGHIAASYNPSDFGVLDPPTPLPQIFALTQKDCTKVIGINNVTYIVDDELDYVTHSAGSFSSQSFFSDSSMSVSSWYSSSSGIGVGVIGEDFAAGCSASRATKTAQSFQEQTQQAVGLSTSKLTTHILHYKTDITRLNLDPNFKSMVANRFLHGNGRPHYWGDSIAKWWSFFDYEQEGFGLMFPTSLTFGASTSNVWRMTESVFQKYGSSWSSQQASFAIDLVVVSVGGRTEHQGGTVSSEFSQNAHTAGTYEFKGGEGCRPGSAGCPYQTWHNSIFTAPIIMTGNWISTATAVAFADKGNEELRQGAIDAVGNITAIRFYQNYAKEQFNIYLKWLSSTKFANHGKCPEIGQPSVCDGCCTYHYTGPLPSNYSNVNAQVSKYVQQINNALEILGAAEQAQWISLGNATSVYTLLKTLEGIYAKGMISTDCYLYYNAGYPHCPAGSYATNYDYDKYKFCCSTVPPCDADRPNKRDGCNMQGWPSSPGCIVGPRCTGLKFKYSGISGGVTGGVFAAQFPAAFN